MVAGEEVDDGGVACLCVSLSKKKGVTKKFGFFSGKRRGVNRDGPTRRGEERRH